MSKIETTADEILGKISFEDYKKPKKVVEPASIRRHQKKNKLTLYLTQEEETLFDAIYIERLKTHQKTDRSALFAEAIRLLYAKEMVHQEN